MTCYDFAEITCNLFFGPFSFSQTNNGEIELISKRVEQQFNGFQAELESNVQGLSGNQDSDDKDKYAKKMEFKCEMIFTKAVDKCKEVFRKTEQDCYRAIKVPGIKHVLCLPLKLTILCHITQALDFLCDSSPVKTDGLMATYYETKDALRSFSKNFKADLKWQVKQMLSLVERVSVQELQAAVNHEIERKKLWFDLILGVTRMVLSVTFIFVFRSAFVYNNRYLREIRFDNVYMTSYFMKIERRRKRHGRRTLLPLRKSEEMELVEPFDCSLQKNEKRKLMKSTLRLMPQILVTLFLITFDHLFYTALDLIQRHSRVDFKFAGHHVIRFAIHGEGAVAQVFRKVFLTFSSEHQVARVSSNKHCLPRPNKVKGATNLLIIGLWLTVWALLYFQAYGLRIRRVICSFFYPKREKKRILFLYNEHLKRRTGFLKQARRKARRAVKEGNLLKEIGILAELRHSFPRMCGWLYRLGMGKKRCLICGEVEKRGAKHCRNRRCKFMYCAECWKDVKGKCYACSSLSDVSSDESASEWDT
ncbi:E3 ubiquitin-protein ligase DCST1-like [Diadema setosum]|uniref:E3 ubiquitin-protein ligase DCST1-like n=1 Tax=Diadema setosum TaxID=31175 RepID=UPI003B3B7F82